MYEFLILILLSWTTHGHPETQSITRIVGGEDAPDGLDPYQVSVTRNYLDSEVRICGGAIINKQWVLSAAQCYFEDDQSFATIAAGSNSLASGDRYNVSHYIRHENYSAITHMNDIALLKIKGEFTFGDKINAIKLPTKDIGAGEDCLVIGYENRNGFPSEKLQMLTVKTISLDDCRKVYSDESVTKNQVCTATRRGHGLCLGDSGRPLVNKGEIVGIASFGVPCGTGYPDVNTRVYAYLDWINRHIAN